MTLETVTKSEVRPPLRMSCTRCIVAGHQCAASAYDAGVAVCHYCLDDVPCPFTKRNPPLRTGIDDGVPLRQYGRRGNFGNMTMPDPMCTRGCGARRHRGACKGKTYGPPFPPKVKAEPVTGDDMETAGADGWRVVDLAEVPAQKRDTLLDELLPMLRDAGHGRALTRTFSSATVAARTQKNLTRVARQRKVALTVRSLGAVLYVSLRAEGAQ